jgi:glycosyltransferase involved in cell wall biosynthesis
MPGEEDFGIVPLEANACGRPVVALARGGARETVEDGETGVLFEEPTRESLTTALVRARETRFDSIGIRAHAGQFSRERHTQHMRAVIDETMAAPVGTTW